MCNHASVEIFFRVVGKEMEQVCLCSFRPNQTLQEHHSADAGFAKPICPSRGICKFASPALLQQSNEITVACSLAANHWGNLPTPPDEAHTAPFNLPH